MKKLLIFLFFISLNTLGQNKNFNTYNVDSNNAEDNSTKASKAAYNKGNEYYNLGDFNNAVIQYSNSINIDKKNNQFYPDAYINRANARIQINDFEGALEDVKIIIDNESEIEHLNIAYTIRASIYGEMGNFNEALEALENSIKLNPNDVNTIYNKARLQILQKKYKDGIETLNKVESIYNNLNLNIPILISSIYYMRGVCKYNLNISEYCDDFNNALIYKSYLETNQVDLIKNICN